MLMGSANLEWANRKATLNYRSDAGSVVGREQVSGRLQYEISLACLKKLTATKAKVTLFQQDGQYYVGRVCAPLIFIVA